MAHFARINDDNTVTEIIVVSNQDCGGGTFPESEPIGQTFIASLGLTGTWLQCSYNGTFRGCYPGPGYVYNQTTDTFEGADNG
jgi:hypothetical protein